MSASRNAAFAPERSSSLRDLSESGPNRTQDVPLYNPQHSQNIQKSPQVSPSETLNNETVLSEESARPLHQQGRLQMSSEKHVLAKLSDAEIVGVSNKMFFPGLFFLPWLLISHNWYLYPVLKWPTNSAIHAKLKQRMIIAGIIAFIYLALLISWIAVYATQWLNWGTAGYKLSLVIPYGK